MPSSPSSSASPWTTLLAPIRIPTDARTSFLNHSAVFRIADHHVGLVDGLEPPPGPVELFCVGQSCTVRFCRNLKERLKEAQSKHNGTESHLWLESIGRTSVTFGQAIRLQGGGAGPHILALATRSYVRQNVVTGALVPWSSEERTRLVEGLPPLPQFSTLLPPLCRLVLPGGTFETPVLTVTLGIQHMNENHVDHAALADIALQAMVPSIEKNPSPLADQPFVSSDAGSRVLTLEYVAPPRPGTTLQCHCFRNREGKVGTAILDQETNVCLAIAQWETLPCTSLSRSSKL